MKIYSIPAIVIMAIAGLPPAHAQQQKYILEREKDIAAQQPGPHDGGGMTTGYSFFSQAKDLKMIFRKRILHKGSAIGYHLQKEDEVYYVIQGRGSFQAGEESCSVEAGTILFVPARQEHRFHSITEELTLLVFFAPAEQVTGS